MTEQSGTTNQAMIDPVATTSRLTAAIRAAESTRPDRLFTDPFAAQLAGEPGRALLDQLQMHGSPIIPVRTRYLDDMIDEVVGRGVRQIVLLAAGMDSRAYRLDLPTDTVVFELDRPGLLHLKSELLGAATPSCTRVPVGVDLTTDFTTPLVAAGFRAELPTCWLVEGLTQYLTEADVHRLLDRITELSAPGCHLLIDFVGTSLLESRAMRPMLELLAARDMTWQYGNEEPETLLESHGWKTTVTRIGTAGTTLGRWPFPDAPRGTPEVPQGYFVHATT
ncbi:SAM-dependent methyltransferase [Nocardia lijiangensis]|uniref:SAM-dependent methyltransferase n=1 Tax=Nocardia lijiangensis TaxID=299618 RepID=UPI000A03087A|nr:SAM-dependent methyltransferase [Nocardia lijiangensis]